MESITWIQRRGQIKHLLYELCLTGRIDRATLAKQFKDLNSVEPIKHGRWKPFDLAWGRSVYACTSCGEAFEVPTEDGKPIYDYCPNCGARMDLDEVEDD